MSGVNRYMYVYLCAVFLRPHDGEHHAGKLERREAVVVPHLVCKVCSVDPVRRSAHNYQ